MFSVSFLLKAICSGFDFPDEYCPLADEEYKLERLHRKPGTTPYAPNLPTYEDVDNALKLEKLDTPPFNETSRHSFRNSLEGMANTSGGYISGLHRIINNGGGSRDILMASKNEPLPKWTHESSMGSQMYTDSSVCQATSYVSYLGPERYFFHFFSRPGWIRR